MTLMIREATENHAMVAAMNNVTSSNLCYVNVNKIMPNFSKKMSQTAVLIQDQIMPGELTSSCRNFWFC
jgi:hypothetical protein